MVVLGLVTLGAAPLVRRRVLVVRARDRATTLLQPLDRDVGAGEAEVGVPAWFTAAMTGLDINIDARRGWWLGLVAAMAAAGWAAIAAPSVLVLAAVGAGAVAVALRGRRRFGPGLGRGRGRGYEADLLAALAAVAAAVGSGSSLRQALRHTDHPPGPCGAALALVAGRLDAGWPVQAALDRWATDADEPAVALVADALAVAGHAGASQSAALVAVGRTIRDRGDRQREIRALVSQARASCAVLVAIPVGFSAVVAATDHRVARFLATTAAGWGCVLGGLALDAAGAWWMARLVRSAS